MAQNTILSDETITLTIMGERTVGWGTLAQRPTSNFHANGWYIATDAGIMYQNTGTEATPVWTSTIEGSNTGLILALGD